VLVCASAVDSKPYDPPQQTKTIDLTERDFLIRMFYKDCYKDRIKTSFN